jgi:hypothetical protein
MPGRRYGGFRVGGKYVRVSRRHQAGGPAPDSSSAADDAPWWAWVISTAVAVGVLIPVFVALTPSPENCRHADFQASRHDDCSGAMSRDCGFGDRWYLLAEYKLESEGEARAYVSCALKWQPPNIARDAIREIGLFYPQWDLSDLRPEIP